MDNVNAEIRRLIEEWATAVHGRNLEAVLRHHAEDRFSERSLCWAHAMRRATKLVARMVRRLVSIRTQALVSRRRALAICNDSN